MRRWEVLRPHVEDGVPLVQAARDAGVAPRTAQRWLAAFRTGGLAALGRQPRADAARPRTQGKLVEVVQGLALTRPRPSVVTITRRTAALATERGWGAPSYGTVREIVAAVDPHLLSLAHDGPAGFRDRFELVHRRQADRPNHLWQADHTELNEAGNATARGQVLKAGALEFGDGLLDDGVAAVVGLGSSVVRCHVMASARWSAPTPPICFAMSSSR